MDHGLLLLLFIPSFCDVVLDLLKSFRLSSTTLLSDQATKPKKTIPDPMHVTTSTRMRSQA